MCSWCCTLLHRGFTNPVSLFSLQRKHCCGLEGALPLTITLTPANCVFCRAYSNSRANLVFSQMYCICMGFYDANLLLSRKILLYVDPELWFDMIILAEGKLGRHDILIWKFPSCFSLKSNSSLAIRYCYRLFSSWSQSNWKHRRRNIMTWAFCATYLNPEFYHNSVYVCVCVHGCVCIINNEQ